MIKPYTQNQKALTHRAHVGYGLYTRLVVCIRCFYYTYKIQPYSEYCTDPNSNMVMHAHSLQFEMASIKASYAIHQMRKAESSNLQRHKMYTIEASRNLYYMFLMMRFSTTEWRTHALSPRTLCFFLSSSDDLYSYTILDVSPGAVLCVSVCLSCCKTNVVNTPKNIKNANRYLNLCWERCDQPSNHPHNGQCKVTVCVIVICRCRCVLGSCIFPQNIRKYSYAECSNAMAHIVERARLALAKGQVSIAACIWTKREHMLFYV